MLALSLEALRPRHRHISSTTFTYHTSSCFSASQERPSVSPFLATLMSNPQLTENPATLSPLAALLRGASSISPVLATLTKNTGGWGTPFNPNSSLPVIQPLLHSPLVYPEASRRATILCRIRTSAKRAYNSRRIRTSKTQDLKPFRMNTYEKTGEGGEGFYPEEHRGASSSFQIPRSRCINGSRD
jgi:hypothetical protein